MKDTSYATRWCYAGREQAGKRSRVKTKTGAEKERDTIENQQQSIMHADEAAWGRGKVHSHKKCVLFFPPDEAERAKSTVPGDRVNKWAGMMMMRVNEVMRCIAGHGMKSRAGKNNEAEKEIEPAARKRSCTRSASQKFAAGKELHNGYHNKCWTAKKSAD